MTPQQIYTLACAFATAIQGIAAAIYIAEWIRSPGGPVMFSKAKAGIFSGLLVVSTALGGFLAHWIWTFKPAPEIKVVTNTVEKPIPVPCPVIKTGSARASAGKGGSANAHSGNNDTYNSNTAPQKPQ